MKHMKREKERARERETKRCILERGPLFLRALKTVVRPLAFFAAGCQSLVFEPTAVSTIPDTSCTLHIMTAASGFGSKLASATGQPKAKTILQSTYSLRCSSFSGSTSFILVTRLYKINPKGTAMETISMSLKTSPEQQLQKPRSPQP